MKPIRFSVHALSYLCSRGFAREEAEDTIRTSPWSPARKGRMECFRDFPYEGLWNGRFYRFKRVRPVFVEEEQEIFVITVYTYYF